MTKEGTVFFVARLPHPWPFPEPYLIHSGAAESEQLQLWALPDGKLGLSITPPPRKFITQPIDINSSSPRYVLILITWTPSGVSIEISGLRLLPDAPGVPTVILPAQASVANEISMNDPTANAACQTWIQNRKTKFSQTTTPRPERRLKTVAEKATDLANSVLILRDLKDQVLAGKRYCLGHLAGEMRASIYWPRLKGNQGDSQPTSSYNPLLLRMASLADLPLPVYFVPKPNIPVLPAAQKLIAAADAHYKPIDAPRVNRAFATDQIRDVQESLISTVLWLGPSRTITALDAIQELANTMGVAHYDEDASEFLDYMESMQTSEGDQLAIFMCHTADALASLSEWVISELRTRNLIP